MTIYIVYAIIMAVAAGLWAWKKKNINEPSWTIAAGFVGATFAGLLLANGHLVYFYLNNVQEKSVTMIFLLCFFPGMVLAYLVYRLMRFLEDFKKG